MFLDYIKLSICSKKANVSVLLALFNSYSLQKTVTYLKRLQSQAEHPSIRFFIH